ncbi:Ig-like domain (group 2) [Lachnospiraceae bacterium KHCPX20]|nr:Ig-like domain (group 2) [Lachnospiraceae bacterium KHCPX20]
MLHRKQGNMIQEIARMKESGRLGIPGEPERAGNFGRSEERPSRGGIARHLAAATLMAAMVVTAMPLAPVTENYEIETRAGELDSKATKADGPIESSKATKLDVERPVSTTSNPKGATDSAGRVHKTEELAAGQSFSRIYNIDLKRAGDVMAKIKADGIGTKLLVIIYGSNSDYFLGHNDLPKKEFGYDINGNVNGSIQTDHIVMADQYHLLVQSVGAVRGSGKLTVDLSRKEASIEDYDYYKSRLNNTRVFAEEYNVSDRKTHTFMLSGYREQRDPIDYYKFTVDRTGYVALRTRTISNKGKVPYGIYLYSMNDNRLIAIVNQPGKSLVTRLVKLEPGDYCIEAMPNDNSKLINHQIIYSLYAARTENITSVSISRKKAKLYTLKGYRKAKLAGRLNHHKAGSSQIRFRSSKPSVVKVSKSGAITAKKRGRAVITCYAIDKPSVKATCKVVVKKPVLKISKTAKSLFVGKSLKLSVKKIPSKQKVIWKSSNAQVASVNRHGVVRAKKAGSAKIYAVSKEGVKSARCQVVVKNKPKPKPEPKPTPDPVNPDDGQQKIAPVLTVSSAHLSPRSSLTVTANVAGGNFSASGGIAIVSRGARNCVIRATTSRGSGTVTYQVNGKSVSKSILIY